VLCSFPESRLLLPALVGWVVLLGCVVQARAIAWRAKPGLSSGLGLLVVGGFVLYQIALPLLHVPINIRDAIRIAAAARSSILSPALDPAIGPHTRVMLFGGADATTTLYGGLVRKYHGRSAPAAWHLVSSTFAPQTLHRISATAFTLERMHPGYTAGDSYADFFTDRPLRVGEQFRVGCMRVGVELVHAGRPLRTRHDFDRPLEDASLLFLLQTIRGLEPLQLPAVGGSVFLPAPVPPFDVPLID
jgi:hypothetical protein